MVEATSQKHPRPEAPNGGWALRRNVVVKDKVGRSRYVAFRLDAPLARGALERLLPPGARLTRFDGTFGILRTTHRERDALMDHLGKAPVIITTLTTSGTIRAAAARLPATARAAVRGRTPKKG